MSSRIAVLDLREGAGETTGAGGFSTVCGLPVLIRNLMLLRRAGIGAAALLVEPEREAKARNLLDEYRTRLPASTVLVGTCDGARLEASLGTFDNLLYWPGNLSFGRYLPAFVEKRPSQAARAVHGGSELGLASIPRSDCVDGADVSTLGLAVAITPVEESRRPNWVRSDADVPHAERELMTSLRKDADGVVARIDRHASLAISRHLMRLPVTPNQVTAVACLIGIGCGILAAHGGYVYMLGGAVLFQLNSIFDGIDGEIARAKLLESRFGQWLDTVSDDLTNFAFVVGVGVGCYRAFGWAGYLALGAIAGLGQLMTSALQYHYLVTVAGSGDLNDYRLPWEEEAAALPVEDGGLPDGLVRGRRPSGGLPDGLMRGRRPSGGPPDAGLFVRLAGRLKWALRRDAFVAFSTIAAVLGQLKIMIWLFAAGASSVWLSIIVYRLKKRLLARGVV